MDPIFPVRFLGAYFQDGQVSFALQYMNRGSLQDVVDQHGPLPESIIRSVLRQVITKQRLFIL